MQFFCPFGYSCVQQSSLFLSLYVTEVPILSLSLSVSSSPTPPPATTVLQCGSLT